MNAFSNIKKPHFLLGYANVNLYEIGFPIYVY